MVLTTSHFPPCMHQTYLLVWNDLICCLSFFTIQQVHTHPPITSTRSTTSAATRIPSVFANFEDGEQFKVLYEVIGAVFPSVDQIVLWVPGDTASLLVEQQLHLGLLRQAE